MKEEYFEFLDESSKASIIIEVCNDIFGLGYNVLSDTKTRRREIVERRQIAIYILRHHTELSLSSIGGIFGKDHATILYAVRTIKDLVQVDKKIMYYVVSIKNKINSIFPVLDIPQKTVYEELVSAKNLNNKLINRHINTKSEIKRIKVFINNLPVTHQKNFKRWMAHS
jgi:hypothetical protein